MPCSGGYHSRASDTAGCNSIAELYWSAPRQNKFGSCTSQNCSEGRQRILKRCRYHQLSIRNALEESQIASAAHSALRCGFCYDPQFNSLGQLANHLEGKRHSNLFPDKDATIACPYCSRKLSKGRLQYHLCQRECPNPGRVRIPQGQIRSLKQQDFDQDPRFAPILQESVPLGVLKIRPMHMQHTFETALVCSEAFKNSAEPIRFDRMLAELRWHAKLYESDPGPVTRQTVNFEVSPQVDLPDVSDVVPERELAFGLSNLFKGPNLGESRELQRLQIAQTWGVWLWIIAELVPTDSSYLPEGQDSVVVGATVVLFHDRLATLEKFLELEVPLSPQSLDQNLFLSDTPPSDLEYKRVAFVWYTSVDPAFRRQGIAGQLLKACEAIGAAAGFWTFYIQADLEQHDHSSILPFDVRRYDAAINAYKKAGYREYNAGADWKQITLWSQSAQLMYKTFRL